MSIIDKYTNRTIAVDSLLCIGLDSDFDRLPAAFHDDDLPQFAFNRWIIEQTHQHTAAYKLNSAFYEARGENGWRAMRLTLDYLRQRHPDIFTICDAKRADIGSTNQAYASAIWDDLGFDAITLHPYLGREALEPFLTRRDKACIILCRTSNPGAGELQDLVVDGLPLWLTIAQKVSRDWNSHQNCMLVVGATYPDELRRVRQTVGEMTLLVPGIGAQGGDLAAVMRGGLNQSSGGLVINVSRAIIFNDHPAAAADSLRTEINTYRRAF